MNVISLARLSAEASAQAGSKDELIGARSDDYTVARRINMVSSSPFFLFR